MRVTTATSTSMYILSFSTPFSNSSYSLEFWGPILRCQNLSDAVLENNLDLGDASSLQEAWDKTMNRTRGYGVMYLAASSHDIWGVNMDNHLFVYTGYAPNGEYAGQNYSCHLWTQATL